MTPSLLVFLIIAFSSAIAVHLGTRLFLGPRADTLWGGAIAVGVVQGMSYAKTAESFSEWVVVAIFTGSAVIGHLVSTHAVAKFWPGLGLRQEKP